MLNAKAVSSQYLAAGRPVLDQIGSTGEVGPSFGGDYVLPELHKWYGPRQLRETYAQPWYTRESFYAGEGYRRYVNQLLEGANYYDRFGTSHGRGWLVYNWIQTQTAARGSAI